MMLNAHWSRNIINAFSVKICLKALLANRSKVRPFRRHMLKGRSMHRIALALALMLTTSPAFAALKVGTRATDFTTQAVLAGKAGTFNLNKALKRGPVVLYFYPKAFTSGCTVEAHEFSEAADDFAAYDASIVGMSADNLETLKRFSVEACRNKFTVGIATKPMIKNYKVSLPMMGGTNRTTYVIAPDGKVLFAYSQLGVKGHVTGALNAVKAWHAANPKRK
jgi:peroxiredoxin